MGLKLPIEKKNAIAFVFSCLNIAMLSSLVGSIEIDELAILIFLLSLYESVILIKSEVFAVDVFKKIELLC